MYIRVYTRTLYTGVCTVQRGALCEREDVPSTDGRAGEVCFNPAAASLSAPRFVTTDNPAVVRCRRSRRRRSKANDNHVISIAASTYVYNSRDNNNKSNIRGGKAISEIDIEIEK